MSIELDPQLEAAARRELTRLIDAIDVEAPALTATAVDGPDTGPAAGTAVIPLPAPGHRGGSRHRAMGRHRAVAGLRRRRSLVLGAAAAAVVAVGVALAVVPDDGETDRVSTADGSTTTVPDTSVPERPPSTDTTATPPETTTTVPGPTSTTTVEAAPPPGGAGGGTGGGTAPEVAHPGEIADIVRTVMSGELTIHATQPYNEPWSLRIGGWRERVYLELALPGGPGHVLDAPADEVRSQWYANWAEGQAFYWGYVADEVTSVAVTFTDGEVQTVDTVPAGPSIVDDTGGRVFVVQHPDAADRVAAMEGRAAGGRTVVRATSLSAVGEGSRVGPTVTGFIPVG